MKLKKKKDNLAHTILPHLLPSNTPFWAFNFLCPWRTCPAWSLSPPPLPLWRRAVSWKGAPTGQSTEVTGERPADHTLVSLHSSTQRSYQSPISVVVVVLRIAQQAASMPHGWQCGSFPALQVVMSPLPSLTLLPLTFRYHTALNTVHGLFPSPLF